MKQRIKEALETRYKNMGFGAKAFEGVAEYLSKTVEKEEDIETAISGVEGLLKAFQADADKTRTAKSDAEKKLAILEAKVKELEGAPEKKDELQSKDTDSDTPAWAKAMADKYEALVNRLAEIEGEKVSKSRKQQLDAIIEKLPEAFRKPYSRVSVKELSDEAFDALKSEIATEVEGLLAETNVKGAVFGRPSGGQAKLEQKATDAELEAIVSKMKI